MPLTLRGAQAVRAVYTTNASTRVVSISLHTGAPTESRRGTSGSNELQDTGYAPATVNAGSTGWNEPSTNASATNKENLSFGRSAALIPSITHWAARDSSDAIIDIGQFTPAETSIPANTPIEAPAGFFQMSVSYS